VYGDRVGVAPFFHFSHTSQGPSLMYINR
jgi:hypothetical protein